MRTVLPVLFVLGLAAGCAAGPQEKEASSSEAYTSPSCRFGNRGRAPICNTWQCIPADNTVVLWPMADGTRCVLADGEKGTCEGGEIDSASLEPIQLATCQPLPVTGAVLPKYYPLTVVYAPPGSASGTPSSVSYADGSTLGSSTKTTHSFKAEVSVSAEATLAGFLTLGGSDGWTSTVGDDSTLEIKKSQTATIDASGPKADGIDHDLDTIYLWLNPQLDVLAQGNSVTWSLSVANDGPTMDVQYVYVGELKDPSTMRRGVAQRLAVYGIGPDDFANILALDPFAYGNAPIDTTRYQPLPTTFPYEPPYQQNDPPNTLTFKLDSSTTNTSAVTASQDTTVGFTSTQMGDITSWLKLKLSESTKLTWTNGSVDSRSSGTTQSAQAKVTGPSFGYTGPTDLAVYYDGLYGTFMFAPVTQALSVQGTVTDTLGQPLAGQEVDLAAAGGTVLQTFTGPQGDYRLYGAPAGSATLTAAGVSQVVLIGQDAVSQNLTTAAN